MRYVERNPLRANLVEEAAEWRWSSLWHRVHGNKAGLLDEGPLALPRRWLQQVQKPETKAELEALRRSVLSGMSFSETPWQERTAKRLGLESTHRARGRPCKFPSEQNYNFRLLYSSTGIQPVDALVFYFCVL
jgi:putative transposase